MKNIYIIGLLAMVGLLISCFKDKSNYDYTPAEKITVTGINSSYDKISQVDSMVIIPAVSSTDPAAKFEYFWGIYETNVQGSAPKVDTICKTLALRYFVKQPAKAWVLVFGAKNKNTGYMSISTSTMNVITQFTRGWYVLKDDGTKTDMDLFLTPTTITPTSKMENVFSLANGRKLDGKAKCLCFESSYKSMVTGTLGNTRAMFIATDKDASIINTNTMLEIKNFNGCFYYPPTVKAPNAMTLGSSADYFINDGQLYSIYSMSSNTGVFGNKQMKDAVNTPYRLADFYVTYIVSDPIFFDEISSSFVSAGGAGTILNSVTDAAGTAMKANNNNKTLLYMGTKATSPLSGVAVFQDKTNPALKILSTITPTVSAFKMVNDTLLNSSKLYNATKYTVNYADESMIYFVVGNEVWSRNLTNKFEQLQFTAPAGETITFIRHKKYSVTADIAFAYNLVMVGTKSGANYTVRMFTKTAGNLPAYPSFTLTGTGSVGDVFYLSPSVSYATYNLSY
jgi:hypothetical protein